MDANIEDRIEALVAKSEHTTVILGTPDFAQFELLDLPHFPEQQTTLSTRGLAVVGVICLIAGQFRTGFYVEVPDSCIKAVSRAFSDRLKAKISASKITDAEWLASLFALQDPRTAN